MMVELNLHGLSSSGPAEKRIHLSINASLLADDPANRDVGQRPEAVLTVDDGYRLELSFDERLEIVSLGRGQLRIARHDPQEGRKLTLKERGRREPTLNF